MIIGRETEQQKLREAYQSEYSEFAAVYGRRRVGKTFLIRETFDYKFTFQHAGLANADKESQLEAWVDSLKEYGLKNMEKPKTWIEAFSLLKEVVRKSRSKKKVLFIDEMPWMDTQHSGFVSALEHFWNGWASARKDILLVVCGSATSWIINKIIKNHGGLHNRVTYRIPVRPFTLKECEAYARNRKLGMSQRQLLECYMVMGGIPFYWSFLKRERSLAQNIDELFFNPDGELAGEFDELYSSLFKNPEHYIAIVTTLGKKRIGMTRGELIEEGGIINNGNLTKALKDLEYCGFIRKYAPLGKKARGAVYQLIDFYTLFYFKFISSNANNDPHFWTLNQESPVYYAWSGLAFERVCFAHIAEVKAALGISGVLSNVYSWQSNKKDAGQRGAQIDMLIDRNDQVIDICEMKFSKSQYAINADDHDSLQNKIARLRSETKTIKAIHVVIVTTLGLSRTDYYDDAQNVITADDLFK